MGLFTFPKLSFICLDMLMNEISFVCKLIPVTSQQLCRLKITGEQKHGETNLMLFKVKEGQRSDECKEMHLLEK